VREARNQS